MAVLQEIPGSHRRSASATESLFHMIACCSYHLAKVSISWICGLSSSFWNGGFCGLRVGALVVEYWILWLISCGIVDHVDRV